MTAGSYIIGCNFLFCPSGTVLAGGNASITQAPVDVTDDATYIDFPCVDSAEFSTSCKDVSVFCPSPGVRVRTAVISTNLEQSWKITLKEQSSQIMRIMFGASSITASSPYVTGTTCRREGWVRLMMYDQSNNVWQKVNFWGSIRPDGTINFNDDVVQVALNIDVIYAAGNKVTET